MAVASDCVTSARPPRSFIARTRRAASGASNRTNVAISSRQGTEVSTSAERVASATRSWAVFSRARRSSSESCLSSRSVLLARGADSSQMHFAGRGPLAATQNQERHGPALGGLGGHGPRAVLRFEQHGQAVDDHLLDDRRRRIVHATQQQPVGKRGGMSRKERRPRPGRPARHAQEAGAAGHLLAREAFEHVDPSANGSDVVDDRPFKLHRAPGGRFGRLELQCGDQVAIELLLPLDQQGHVILGLR